MSYPLLEVKLGHQFDPQYLTCVEDLLADELVLSMAQFIQHGNVTCLDHCLQVSYSSYLIGKKFNLDYRSMARGGLLHDFFLYDWHLYKPKEGLHGFVHAEIALHNALKHFDLNPIERDIIEKHMWPLNINPPRCKEALLVCLVDKYCATLELEFVNVNLKKRKVSQMV